MAKITGPLLSFDASGSIGGAMTFSKWKGRGYVRQLVTPANPQTPLQTSNRAVMRFLSVMWQFMGLPQNATWEELARQRNISAFNACVSKNMRDWQQGLYPAETPDRDYADDAAIIATATATAGNGIATIDVTSVTVNSNIGLAVHRSTTTGFTPSRATLVYIIETETVSSPWSWTDSGLAPDTYYYKVIPFADGGKPGTASSQLTAVVT